MSAFFVEKSTIDHIVAMAIRADIKAGRQSDDPADIMGRLLWLENVKSLRHRYPGDDWGTEEQVANAYTYIDPVGAGEGNPFWQAVKSADCYCYQSCEHDEWESSEAKKIADKARAYALMEVGHKGEVYYQYRHDPGYEAAAWE